MCVSAHGMRNNDQDGDDDSVLLHRTPLVCLVDDALKLLYPTLNTAATIT